MNNSRISQPDQPTFPQLKSQDAVSNSNDQPNAKTVRLLTPANSQLINPIANAQNQPVQGLILQHLCLNKMDVCPTLLIKNRVPTANREPLNIVFINTAKSTK